MLIDFFKKHRFKKQKEDKEQVKIKDLFKYKYTNFKELLQSNTELGILISEISDMLDGNKIFGMDYIRSRTAMAVSHAQRMIRALNAISNDKYHLLYNVLGDLQARITQELYKTEINPEARFIIPYSEINREMVDLVGGKNANLGDARNRAKVPVPDGFAITTYAYKVFMEENDLFDLINKKKTETDIKDHVLLNGLSEDVQAMILRAKVPEALGDAILDAFDKLEARVSSPLPLRVAMRSSAIGEDSHLSFAGQYVSMLNVSRERIINSYKIIVAGLFTPRAIAYRFNMGLREEDLAMAVACIQMVGSRSSGVLYTIDPLNPKGGYQVINSIWGLGAYVVDGTLTPDTFHVSREEPYRILLESISYKPIRLVMSAEGGLVDEEVPESHRARGSVGQEELLRLCSYAMALERHFKGPQDIEWAIDHQGKIYILQSRPIVIEEEEAFPLVTLPEEGDYQVLAKGGEPAFKGVAHGIAWQVGEERDLSEFPQGGVLVIGHSSPEYAVIIPKAAAVLADTGSVTGHMATVAREFKVPCIINMGDATDKITHGTEVTVDSYNLLVYKGKILSLLEKRPRRAPVMEGTPVLGALKAVSQYIIPLNLLDPRSQTFRPESIRTIHDLMRFVHERSYEEMFRLSDQLTDGGGQAFKVRTRLPIDLYAIDLGGGILLERERQGIVRLEDICSVPLIALLKGMREERDSLNEPRPVNLRGFLSVLTEQALSPPGHNQERFGDKSYAIISDKYMNFSSRVGYHFSILDTYCGETLSKNYITFYFIGGAADDVRRNRRARAISWILKELGFNIEVINDSVTGRFLKYPKDELLKRLQALGRLLEYTRQMDMLMESEASVKEYATRFLDSLKVP